MVEMFDAKSVLREINLHSYSMLVLGGSTDRICLLFLNEEALEMYIIKEEALG